MELGAILSAQNTPLKGPEIDFAPAKDDDGHVSFGSQAEVMIFHIAVCFIPESRFKGMGKNVATAWNDGIYLGRRVRCLISSSSGIEVYWSMP